MLLKEFPNLIWLKQKANERFSDRRGVNGQVLEHAGWPTVLLQAKSRNEVRDQIRGPLSIFTNLSGSSLVSTGKSRARVTPDVFFVTNADQFYTLEIAEPTETFNIHVGEKVAESIFYQLAHSEAFLLDNPVEENAPAPAFHNKLYWRSDDFNSILARLQHASSKLEEEEQLGALLSLLLTEHHDFQKRGEGLKLKKSTQEEIMRRVCLAFDYLASGYTSEIDLDALSRISCLSKFHFLRLFKQVFGETPHQCLVRLRLEKSKMYLRQSALEVKAISRLVGFADSTSFSRSFKMVTNLSPTEYRNLARA